MKCLALLLVVAASACYADDTAKELTSILGNIGLSEDLIAKIKPKNVDVTNENIRQFVAGLKTAALACKGTAKTTACKNTLAKYFKDLKTKYANLKGKAEALLEQTSDETKAKLVNDAAKIKEKLQAALSSLKGNSILSQISSLEGLVPKPSSSEGASNPKAPSPKDIESVLAVVDQIKKSGDLGSIIKMFG